jgi:hypothetical protein
MKKIFTLLVLAIFSLAIFASPVFADRGDRHSGRSGGHSGYSSHSSSGHRNNSYNRHYNSGYRRSSHGHSSHNYINGWEAAAIGFGAAVVGSAIINSYPRERTVVVERNTYYAPPPPPCRDYDYNPPARYVVPTRVWVPGHYEWVAEGYYRRIPGYWD